MRIQRVNFQAIFRICRGIGLANYLEDKRYPCELHIEEAVWMAGLDVDLRHVLTW